MANFAGYLAYQKKERVRYMGVKSWTERAEEDGTEIVKNNSETPNAAKLFQLFRSFSSVLVPATIFHPFPSHLSPLNFRS